MQLTKWRPIDWLAKRLRRVEPQQVARWRFPVISTRTVSGVRISEDTALSISAVWACVRIVSQTLAGLSWHVMTDTNKGKERVPNQLDFLLDKRPNPEMPAFTFRETLQAHAMLWGNAYAEIERANDGRVLALWPLPPDRMEVARDDVGNLVYNFTPRMGETVQIPARFVFHVPGMGFDGLRGYSVVTYAREAFGMSMAAERFGAGFFGNGLHPGGMYEHPDRLGDEALRHLRESLQATHGGPSNVGKTLILEEGMKYHPLSIPPEDAQFLETRKFQVVEVCRLFGVPPHKIGDLERSTFSNIEHQAIEFVQDAILPWVQRWEQAANLRLVRDNANHTRMNLKSLLRGDMESQARALQLGFDRGWYDIDEVRELLDLNRIGGEIGKLRVMQGAMKSVDDIMNPPEPPAPPAGPPPPNDDNPQDQQNGNDQERTKRIFAELFASVVDRVVTRERKALTRAMQRYNGNPDGFETWAAKFYAEQEDVVRDALNTPVRVMALQIKGGPVDQTVNVHHIIGTYTTDYMQRARKRAETRDLRQLSFEPSWAAEKLTEAVCNG